MSGNERAADEDGTTVRFNLTNTRSVVVGASQGIGAGIAIALAEAGSAVVLAGRDVGRLADTERQVGSVGQVLGKEVVDVSSAKSVRAFRDTVLERYGVPTILVNSANYGLVKSALDTTLEDWNSTFDVHLRGPFLTCQAFASAMSRTGYGKIVNLSSRWSDSVGHGRSAYGAAKAGLNFLTAALAVEWGPMGLRVNAIAPAAILTPTVRARLEEDPTRADYLRSGIPLGRLGTTDDVIGAALYLASPASDFVSGHVLFVDGGARAAT